MTRVLPVAITIPCINRECTNEMILRLDQGYYKDRMYDGSCSRCGIRVIIERFSPFLSNIEVQPNTTQVLSSKVIKVNRPVIHQ